MNSEKTAFILGKKNIYTIVIGFALVIIGFALMSGGASTSPDEFEKDVIFSTRRITVAPITVVIGFIVVGVGIMLKPSATLVEEEN